MIAQLSRYLKRFDIRISLIYGIIAILWISFSDFFPLFFFSDNHAIQTAANTLIGWGFVLVTTGGLYLLLSAELRKRARVEKELQLERDISPIAIVVFGTDGRISYANSQAEKTLGKPRSEIIGKLFDDANFHVTDYAGNPVDVMPIIMQLAETKQTVYGIQQAILSAHGERILLEINLAPLINNSSEITAIVGTFSDVTAAKTHEKQLRDSQERFRLLFNNNPLPIAVYDPDTLAFIEVNDATLDHYGYTRDEFLHMVVSDLRLPDDKPELIEDTQQMFRNMLRTERQHRLKNGRIIEVQVTSQGIDYNGRKAIMAVADDITKRKQAEKALRDSEYSLKQAQAIAHVGDWSWDKQNNVLRWSDEMYSIFGIDQSTFTGNPNNIIPMVIHPDDYEIGMRINQALLEGKQRGAWEYRIIWPDGSIRHLRTESGETLFGADGTVLRLSGIVQDITERKQVEQAIRDSERSLKRAQSVARVGDWSWNIKTNELHASDEIYTILGLDKATFTGDISYLVEHVIHPDDEMLLINTIEMSMRGQKPENFECRVIWPDGSVHDIWAEVGEETTDDEGIITNMSGIIQDITDRKQAERALRESEASLKLAQAVAHVGSWTLNVQNNTAHASDEAYRIFGLTPDTSKQNFSEILARSIHPSDLAIIMQGIETILKGANPDTSECRVLWPDGTVRHVWVELGEIQRDSHGNIIQLTGIVQDITERKLAEQALRESEASLKRAQNIASIGDWTWDTQTNIVRWSDEMYHIFGLDRATSTGDLNEIIEAAIHPDDKAIVNQANEAVLNKQRSAALEYRIVWPDKSVHIVWAEPGEAVKDAQGKILFLSGIVQDITERKLAEQALRESELRYRTLIDQASDGIYLATSDGHFLDVNTSGCHMIGYTREELLQMSILDVVKFTPERPLRFDEVRNGKTVVNEFQLIRSDGTFLAVEISTKQLSDGNLQGIVRDITERKAAEQAVRDSEIRYRTLIEQASEAIFVAEVGGYYVEANSAACGLLGYTRDEILQKQMLDLFIIPPDKPLRAAELAQGKTLLIERQMIRKDGSLVSVEVSSKLLTDGTIQAIARDITERKRAEQDLRLKSTALDSAGNGIVITDIHGTIEWINPAFTYLTGYQLDEVLGHNPRELVRSGLHNHLFYENLWSTILAGKVWKGELVNRRKDGTLYTEEQTITPVRDDTGQISHFVAIQQDVTARKLAEAAVNRLNTELEERVIERTTQLNHIKNRIESILNSNADSIVYSNINGFIEQINPAFTQTFGYEPHEIALQPLKALVAEKDIAEFEAAVANVRINRQVQQVDVSSSRKDGTVFDAAMMLSPVIESSEQMVGIVVSIHDVTSRNLMLHHAMDLNELKSRYVAMAAHDLRNPMAVILSSTSGLEGYYDKLTPDRRQAKFDQIKSNIKVMTDILNDILVMGQVDSGKMEFHPAPLDLIALCQTLVAEAIEGSGTTTKVDFVTQEINNWMLMDAKLLRHILSNLLSNAIKYSPAGSTVTFKARCIGEHIEFTIRDEGIGIPKDDQARLFETFHRASNAKHIRGTGLGLAIVKQSVELHGGTISFESQEGQGTTFNILLPASES